MSDDRQTESELEMLRRRPDTAPLPPRRLATPCGDCATWDVHDDDCAIHTAYPTTATPGPEPVEPRYRYERYQNPYGESEWDRRVQWLVFDRRSIGCLANECVEREAALICAALNAFDGSPEAEAFTEREWAKRAVRA